MNAVNIKQNSKSGDFWKWFSTMLEEAKRLASESGTDAHIALDILELVERLDTPHLTVTASTACYYATQQNIQEALLGERYLRIAHGDES